MQLSEELCVCVCELLADAEAKLLAQCERTLKQLSWHLNEELSVQWSKKPLMSELNKAKLLKIVIALKFMSLYVGWRQRKRVSLNDFQVINFLLWSAAIKAKPQTMKWNRTL